jgi:hypothetical protein
MEYVHAVPVILDQILELWLDRVCDFDSRWIYVCSDQADPVRGWRSAAHFAPISDEQQRRGKALRTEVEKLYADMKAHGTLKPESRGCNFITDTIAKYVPVGSSFEDAEAVLRAAGCVIDYPVKRQVIGHLPGDDVRAHAVIERHLLGTNLFDVDLTPRSPGDYAVVTAISAEFDLRSL